ncbi:sm-like protein LSM8 isoform X3 [Gossypium arboreum]|uniref:sm-like protein LSM8 isoform X3 n=1 Tax=Gossypium arboreum TaxID=29729 RepID=UPI0022F16D6B|nr:sm-like protein LSM8 isoform X3 [Gossypium arboreum]
MNLMNAYTPPRKGYVFNTDMLINLKFLHIFGGYAWEGVQQLVLGLYIIRGDNISVVGELDEELDSALDLSNLRAHPLKPVIH